MILSTINLIEMRSAILIICVSLFSLLLFGFYNQANSQEVNTAIGFERYYERTEFLMTSPGAMHSGLYGYDNPALLHFLHQPDIAFHWTSDSFFEDTHRWGGFFGFPGASFNFVRNDLFGHRYRDYRIAFGGGSDAAAAGFGINWYRGDTDLLDLKTNFTFGTMMRPSRYISVGFTGTSTFSSGYYEVVAEMAVRPLGTPLITVFGDFAVSELSDNPFDGRWSAGAAVEAFPGVRFTGRYLDDVGMTAGIQFSFGRAGISYQSHLDSDGHHRYNTYNVRAGGIDRNVFDHYYHRNRSYVDMNIRGSLPYQTFQVLDQRTTYLTTLDYIYEAGKDRSVSGIILNTTHMQIDQARTWEIRKALEDFRQTGKEVVVYIERGGMNTLHLASVADYVVVDPLGSLTIPGYVTGATYISDLLTTAGIGVDEFREMEYKSAFESMSRTEMSEADREQRLALINGFYELVKDDVTSSRSLSGDDFDTLIDRGISLSPRDLVEAGIADTLARFTDMNDIIEEFEGEKKHRTRPGNLYTYQKLGDDNWGPKHKIAVFYAEGPTMNETGIRARALSAAIRKARHDRSVKAVVLRADSPGGDALASDLVAEEIRLTAEDKPVIVSMGSVAASGGYWISMHADTIVAAPNTITGSIGVIGGWFWDDGLSDHLRLHTDHVSRGESADLNFGPTLPLLGLRLPGRALTDSEREGLVSRMNGLYQEFIDKVAEGRDSDPETIEAVAAGRVWTGHDAMEQKLVDELGSLYSAIHIAREKAGLTPDDKFEIVEGPKTRLLSPLLLLGQVFGSDAPNTEQPDPIREYLELMIDNNARPLVMLPFEYFSWMYYLQE